MGRPHSPTLLLAGAILAALVVACTASGGPTSTPGSPSIVPTAPPAAPTSTSPGESPSASSLPAPSPSALDGTLTFAFVTVDESDWKARCAPGRGVVRVADARVAGQYVVLICLEQDDEVAADGFWDFWARYLIWNDGGTWDGQCVGAREDATADHVAECTFAGSGQYVGLRLTAHQSAGRDDRVWDVRTAIGPGFSPDPISTPPEGQGVGDPQVAGTRSCGNVIVAPSEMRAGDVTRIRGEVDVCTWEVPDPRFAGPDVTIISADIRDDGSMVGWGSVTTRFGVGPYVLERAADGTTTVRTFLTGAGRYSGLVYRDVQVGAGDTWSVTGWVSPAG